MRHVKGLGAAIVSLACALALGGCQREEPKRRPDFSNYRNVAELATLDCYYHNVGVITVDGNDVLWFVRWGANRGWFEYRGSVALGIDASRVEISDPDANNVVTIAMPQVEVLGTPKVDEASFSDIYQENAVFPIDLREQSDAFAAAQAAMKEDAEKDENLRMQAHDHAKALLKEYVLNVGEALGENYTVEFIEAKSEEDADRNVEDVTEQTREDKPSDSES